MNEFYRDKQEWEEKFNKDKVLGTLKKLRHLLEYQSKCQPESKQKY